MTKKIKIKINGKSCLVDEGQTILAVAKKKGIFIPTLCQHDDFAPPANCRVCLVEVRLARPGKTRLVTSCSTMVQEGMEISTESERAKLARNANLELIYAEHIEKCADCVWRFECKLLDTAHKYKLLLTEYKDRKRKRNVYRFANAVEIDGTQCIDCRNCISACSQLQNINYLELKGKGHNQEVVPTQNKSIHCILCGQCAVHCPVSAAQEQADWRIVEEMIADPEKVVVAQFAPAIRASIGEDFGLPHGMVVEGQMVTALRQLGFDYVFDVNFGADVTTMVEAKELLDRINQQGDMPMITSCCPAWVNYVEFYHSKLIPHLTTSRSPQIHLGGIIKTYWAEIMKIKPENIVVVSIMPCTAKKYESIRPEMKINDMFPVDYVLTTREFSFLMKKNNINLANLPETPANNPMGEYSGAAAIYGASGGVMESALRTANFLLFSQENKSIFPARLEYKSVRGLTGVKEAKVAVGKAKLRVAVVSGIKNVEPVLANLSKYDYIEVMACPGGCIGGGGQPIPTTDEIRKKRMAALYELDKNKKLRFAHKNIDVLKILDWIDDWGQEFEHKILHTKYFGKTKF